MKRIFIALLAVLILCSSLSAGVTSENRQKIYDVYSDEYRAMKYLYIAEGLALPSTSGPWSAAELDMMLSRVEEHGIDDGNMEICRYLKDSLAKEARLNPDDNFGLTISADVAIEAYMHTNSEDFTSPDSYARKARSLYGDYNLATPLVSVPLETWIGNNIYGYSAFDLGVNRSLISLDNDSSSSASYKGTNISHNIIFIPPTQMNDLNLNFPYRAFGSIGGDWWNISIGRERLSWGPGESGNFVIGDQIPYHNNARFTAFTNSFKYIFSLSSFIHPSNYFDTDSNGLDYFDPSYDQTAPRKGLEMMVNHRIEWRIANKVNMALTESIMYANSEGSIDFLVLSPTAIFHNYYIRGNANSLISLELDFSPVRHWDIYAQVAIDEFKLPGEFSNDGPPSASAYQVGAKFSYPMGKGVLYGSIEGTYTDPWLYLRDDGDSYSGNKAGINFIVGIPEFTNSGGNYTLNYVGYRYGGDAIVARLNVGYEVYDSYYVDSALTYIAHGCFDALTRWEEVVPGSKDDPSAPSSSHPSSGNYSKDPNWEARNAVSHTVNISIEGGYTPIANLNLFMRGDIIFIVNSGNIKGVNANDLQLSLGVSYSF